MRAYYLTVVNCSFLLYNRLIYLSWEVNIIDNSYRKIKYSAVAVSIIISFSIFLAFFNIINLNYKKSEQAEKIKVLQDLVKYKSKIENEINSRVQLLNGYLAFVKTYPQEKAENSLKYIGNLINKEDKIIKNLSIIKDTTIVWTYPKEGNEKAIGVDLSKIEKQRDSILTVKNKGIILFDGPVNLVQGGEGFIVRVPVYDKTNNYWGQLSIVMDSKELEKYKADFEEEYGLRIALYNNNDFPNNPFWGENIEEKDKPLIFETSINNLEWVIAAVPIVGWENNNKNYIIWTSLSMLFAIMFGVLVYNYIDSSNIIKRKLIYDSLTGAYSRAFLDAYAPIAFSKAQRNNTKLGILVIDLNDFKSINDKYGHLAGDRALQSFFKALNNLCRKNDSIMRIGGDEFLIIFDNLKKSEDFNVIIKKIERNSKLSLVFNGNKINYTYSLGGAIYPDDGDTIDKIVSIADKNMYANKKLIKETMALKKE